MKTAIGEGAVRKDREADGMLHSLFRPLPVPCPSALHCLPKIGYMLFAVRGQGGAVLVRREATCHSYVS